jgi:hypothetical protein
MALGRNACHRGDECPIRGVGSAVQAKI